MTEPSPDVVKAIAETIAREITAHQPASSADPVVIDATELAATYNGTFTLAIKYETTTYTLTVTIPTQAGGTYDFELKSLKDGSKDPAETIASFKYTAADNWSVVAGLPQPITWGNITLETVSITIAATPS
jgi:hypothetical protein